MDISNVIIQNIIESLPVGLIVVGPGGKILTANSALASILGHPLATIIEKGWSQFFFSGNENFEFNQIFLDVIQKEMVDLRRHVPYAHPDGEQKYLDVVSSYLKENEELSAIVLVIDDVTEIHTLYEREKNIFKQNTELHKERSEGLNKLAMSIAHQIRNPVATIGGFANILLRKDVSSEKEEAYLEAMRVEAVKLERFVKAIKEYSSLTACDLAWFEIETSLHDAVEAVQQMTHGRDECVVWDFDIEKSMVLGNKELLVHAWSEILTNSLDFASNNNIVIEITCCNKKNFVKIEFVDNQETFHPQNLPFIFDPFFTTRANSVGMGLAKVKRIISEHHGEIFAECINERQLKINIFLPVETDAAEDLYKKKQCDV
jgi:PAS domain S-box-containing protein